MNLEPADVCEIQRKDLETIVPKAWDGYAADFVARCVKAGNCATGFITINVEQMNSG